VLLKEDVMSLRAESILKQCPRCGAKVVREQWGPKTLELRNLDAHCGTVSSLPTVPAWAKGDATSSTIERLTHYCCLRCRRSIAVLAR